MTLYVTAVHSFYFKSFTHSFPLVMDDSRTSYFSLLKKNLRKTFLCMSYYVSIYWVFCQIWPGVELLSVRPYTYLISTTTPSTKPLNNFPSYSEWNTKLSKHLQGPFLSPPVYLSYCIFSFSPLHFLRLATLTLLSLNILSMLST